MFNTAQWGKGSQRPCRGMGTSSREDRPADEVEAKCLIQPTSATVMPAPRWLSRATKCYSAERSSLSLLLASSSSPKAREYCRCSKLRMLSTLPKPDETRMILTVSTEGPQTHTLACGHVDLTPRVVREDNQHSSAHRVPR